MGGLGISRAEVTKEVLIPCLQSNTFSFSHTPRGSVLTLFGDYLR